MDSAHEEQVARQLYQCCAIGDHATLTQLLNTERYAVQLIEATNKPDAPKAIVEKTIYTACLRGHYAVVRTLLRRNINVNMNSGFGTPIYAAAKCGSLDIVKLLIEYGAEYKRVRSGFSPLFVACVEGQLNILRYLVNVGADLYAFSNPPLVFTACMQGHLQVLQFLMEEMEYDIHRTINGENALRMDGKDSLLYVACCRSKIDVADYLLSKGAIITQLIATKFSAAVKQLLEKRIRQSHRPSKPGSPPNITARWKELGLAEIPWAFISTYSHKITKLELRSNRLSSIPEQIFQMPHLKTLDVSQNLLPELTQEDVEWHSFSLADVDASRNQIAYLPPGLFTLPELATLNISYNLLQRLPGDTEDGSPDVIWTCEKLKRLDISHNRLRSLPDRFDGLRRLNTLNVSYNYLNDLPQTCSWGSISLVHLDASHNHLQELPIGSSTYWMHCLERLYLSHNEFTEITRDITELTRLTTLDLSHNRIEYLPVTSSWTNTRMTKLSLAHNLLSTLTHQDESSQTYTQSGSHPAPDRDQGGRTTVYTLSTFVGKRKKPKRGQEKGDKAEQAKPPDNEPRELPVDKWSSTLQSLFLSSNLIKFLPDYIGLFVSLARLDISNNPSIHCLPLKFGKLKNCWELIMNGLEITNIPKNLLPGASRGASTKNLIAYLRAQLKNSKPYNRMKLMAVGLQGRGKTTLISVLRNPNAPLPENISTVGVNVHDWVIHPVKIRGAPARHQQEVVFSTWDLAGQEVYYATHQCFLSRNTLYLLVWNMEEGEKGINFLRPWLLNVQARAPYSPVLIVATHLDKIPSTRVNELKQTYRSKIIKYYDKDGFPKIHDICFVSCVTREGIKELQERIHFAAVEAKDPDTREYVIGMQVPSSYIDLQVLIAEEARKCREQDIPPVLNQREFALIAEKTGDINDPEELSLAAQFLHDNGVLLHYSDHLKGLNNLYFIDPVWLADMLAHIITVPEKQAFVQNGILQESHVKIIFHGNKNFPEKFLPQYLQLLERFEIALSLGQGSLLIPSMLPVQRPALPFAAPLPRVRSSSKSEPRLVPISSLIGMKPSEEASGGGSGKGSQGPQLIKVVDGKDVIATPVVCVRRRYRMAYIPSGFWSRLISRLIINLKRSGLVETRSPYGEPSIIYWRRGIVVMHGTGKFLVESIQPAKSEMSGVGVSSVIMDASVKLIDDKPSLNAEGNQGVDITVWSQTADFSAMGYIVDQLDSLIDEWFPGLNDLDYEGEWLVQRQAMWVAPQELVESLTGEQSPKSPRSPWLMGADAMNSQEVFVFRLEECALEALMQTTVHCQEYDVHVPLSHLVPDLLLTDLPSHLMVDTQLLEFNPKDPSTRLGRGGAGAVYRGRYRHEPVAIKEFLTQSQAEAAYDEDEQGAPAFDPQDDSITAGEALFLFRDLRQEVTVLAQLSHPNIVSLLGVSLRPMCIVIELAPMGSLFGILDRRLEAVRAAQADLPSTSLRMPGGVLGSEVSARVAIQVALALRYLHKHGIVYRDLKSDNVLIWSLDVEAPVNAKLADYGISRFANPGGIKGEEGTPGYMAPEAIRRRGEDQAFDEKVDMFSFGMLLFELLTGQRPFENLTSGQEVNRAVLARERPQVTEGNADSMFPAMIELMEDCWKHLATDRPTTDEVVSRIQEPGFLCRRHTVTHVRDHPIQKIDTIYSRPVMESEKETSRNYTLWTWSRQDTERNFSIFDVRKGVFHLPEKSAPGGRVYAMAATGEVDKRIWIATDASKNYPDFEIQVYGYKMVGDPQCLWSFVVKDSVLDMATEIIDGRVRRVFVSLANGTICIFSRKSLGLPSTTEWEDTTAFVDPCHVKCDDPNFEAEAADWRSPLVLKVSEGIKIFAIKCMTFVGKNRLWCGCGNNIAVIDTDSLKVLTTFPVFTKRTQFVNELVSDGERVWGIGRQLPFVMEWDAKTYELKLAFDCSKIEPSGKVVVTDPCVVPDISLPDRYHAPKEEDRPLRESPKMAQEEGGEEGKVGENGAASSSDSSLAASTSPKEKATGFTISNEPQDPSKAINDAPFALHRARKTLRDIKPRSRVKVMTKDANQSIFAARPEMAARQKAYERALLRHQGATRITSLLLVDETLWIARGMGDLLVVDVCSKEDHGMVLGRMASEDLRLYGNRSNHKLALVGGDFVASSQWLEPLETARSRAATIGVDSMGRLPSISVQQLTVTAHQQITIWEAWSYTTIRQYNEKITHMLQLDSSSEINDS